MGILERLENKRKLARTLNTSELQKHYWHLFYMAGLPLAFVISDVECGCHTLGARPKCGRPTDRCNSSEMCSSHLCIKSRPWSVRIFATS